MVSLLSLVVPACPHIQIPQSGNPKGVSVKWNIFRDIDLNHRVIFNSVFWSPLGSWLPSNTGYFICCVLQGT